MCAHRFVGAIALLLLATAVGTAQVSRHINAVNVPPSADQGVPVAVSIELLPTSEVSRALLRYRAFGVTEYTEMEMLASGQSYATSIPAEIVSPPYVQYYFALELRDGSVDTYPEVAPDINPLQLTVNQQDPREREIIFLSPEPGQTVAIEEFVLALSLYYATPAVNASRTKILFNGVDVSREAILSDDIILWSPANSQVRPKLGSQSVRVELRDTLGELYYTKDRSFSLSTAAALEEEASRLTYSGDVRAEYRNEQTSNAQTYARVETRANGAYSFLRFGGNLRLDNLEDPSRQPQNRYFFYADAEYARVEVGDAYPANFPTLMMIGKRVRGITGALKLGFFNLDVSFGKTERAVEGLVDSVVTYPDSASVDGRPLESRQLGADYFTYEVFRRGTYDRDLFAIRPSFGSGENFQLGFSFLKFADDTASINYGVQPKQNLVVGADMKVGLDDQRIRWESQVAVGIQNKDITGGTFSDADYDSLKAETGTDLKALGQIADDFIIVNGNLEPLNPAGKGLPGLSMESFLTLNYFNNYVRAQFVRRGTAYKSYGNEFLQSDIQGISVSDNVRLFSNKVFASVSYESKHDNLSDSKAGTTSYNTLTTAFTYSPGSGYPTLQLGYGLIGRVADQIVFRPDSAVSSKAAEDDATRLTFGLSYDLRIPIRNFITFSISSVDRADKTIYKRDQTSMLVQATVATFFEIPLQTSFSVVSSSTKSTNQLFSSVGADSVLTSQEFSFTSISVGGQYLLLDNQLRLQTRFAPTFGDVERTLIRFGADYSLRAHVFELLLDYYKNTGGVKDDTILSFIYRFNF